jgi:hypothetical protein
VTASMTVRSATFDARRTWFGLDAVVTGANALGYLALGGWLSDQLGASASSYRTIGGALLLFAVSVGVYAATDRAPRWAGWSIVAVNASWVVGSLVVAAAGIGDVNGLGRAWIVAQAVVVAALTVMQASTIRHR